MTKKTDGRTKRGEVRRMVWREAADCFEHEGESVEAMGLSPDLADLYNDTRLSLVRWMKARGRGVMGPPPGGVGTR